MLSRADRPWLTYQILQPRYILPNSTVDSLHRRYTRAVLYRRWYIIPDYRPCLRSPLQFELAPVAEENAGVNKARAPKSRSKVIQEDEEENEWDQDQLEDGGSEEGSSYEVRSVDHLFRCTAFHASWFPKLELRWPLSVSGNPAWVKCTG